MARRKTAKPDARPTGTGEGEGWEDFERKREWFLRSRGVGDEQSRSQLRLAAIAQVDLARLSPVPSWPAPLKADFDLTGAPGGDIAVAEVAADGALAAPLVVTLAGDAADGLLRVRTRVPKSVDAKSIRLFRHEPRKGSWRLVADSGFDAAAGAAWGRIRLPGVYAPFGLAAGQLGTKLAAAADEDMDSPEPPARQLAFELARARDAAPPEDFEFPDAPAPGPGLVTARGPRPPEIGWWKLGPRNINGRIKSLAIHPNNRNYLLAGAANGGVWRSTDAGASWNARWFGQLSMAIGSIAFAPSNPNRVYAATGEDVGGWNPAYGGAGVYRSNNAGTSWTLCDAGPGDRCSKLVIHPTLHDTVYVASDSGLWKSMTGGMGVGNWVRQKTGHITDVLIDPDFPQTLYCAQWNTGLFKSTDGGDSWNPCNGADDGVNVALPTGNDAEWPKLAMGFRGNHKTKYIVAKLGLESGQIYYSVNGATNWLKIPGTHNPVRYNEWTNMISVHPTHSKKMIAGSVNMSRTINRFTWNPTTGTHSDHHQIVYDPVDPNIVYVATDGGVYRSDNGGRDWVLRSHGMTATQLYGLGVSQSGSLVIGCGTQDQGIIGLQGGSELDWFDYHAGNEGGFFVVDPSNNSTLYCCPWSHDLRRSTNGGASWTDIRNGMSQTVDGVESPLAKVSHLAVRPDNSNSLIAGGKIVMKDADDNVIFTKTSIYRSLDQGNSWMSRKITEGDVSRVAFAPSDGKRSYAATSTGNFYRAKKTTYEWIKAHTPANKPSNDYITGIGVSWTNPDRVYISLGGYGGTRVARSEDAGSNWVSASGTGTGALPGIPINSVAVDSRADDVVYAATDIGVFRTLDAGASWHDFNDGWAWQDVPRIVVTELQFRRVDFSLYASTIGRGVYRRRV